MDRNKLGVFMLIRQEKKIERFSQLGTSTFRVKIEKLNHNHTFSRRCKYMHSYQLIGKMSRFFNCNYLRVFLYHLFQPCLYHMWYCTTVQYHIWYCTTCFHLRNIGLDSYNKIDKLPQTLHTFKNIEPPRTKSTNKRSRHQ